MKNASKIKTPVVKHLQRRKANTLKTFGPVKLKNKRQHRGQDEISLMKLNDDCLRVVLKHLDIRSLCQMANVCRRLRPLTSEIFHRHHKEIRIQGCHDICIIRRIIFKFGHLIATLYFSGSHKQIDLNTIIEYCKNVRELHIYDATIDCERAKNFFAQLTILTIKFCQFSGDLYDLLSSCTNLQNITYSPDFRSRAFYNLCNIHLSSDANHNLYIFMSVSFPSLREIAIRNVTLVSRFWSGTVFYFLRKNPLIEKFTARVNDVNVVPKLIYASNLKSLYLMEDRIYRKIKPKWFCGVYREYIYRKSWFHPHIIKEIPEIKQIESLYLGSNDMHPESDFVTLVNGLPLLTRLELNFRYKKLKSPFGLSNIGLKNVVETGKQLDYLGLFGVKRLRIDQEFFEILLETVKTSKRQKKLKIFITGCVRTTKFNVPKTILQASEKYLEIFYNKYMDMDGDDYCECKSCAKINEEIRKQDFPYI